MNNHMLERWTARCADRLSRGVLHGAVVSSDQNVIDRAVSGVVSAAGESGGLILCDCPVDSQLLGETYFVQAYFARVLEVLGAALGSAMPPAPPVPSAFLRLKIVTKTLFANPGRRCLLVCRNFSRCLDASDPNALDDLCGNLVSIFDCADEMGMSYLLGSDMPVQEVERHKKERSPSSLFSRVRDFTLEDMP